MTRTNAGTGPVTRPRRGRPPGRTARQEQQREQNRAAILVAASRVFAAKPYVHATIDDIIAAAGISRATFYVHFESKLALAIAIYDSIAPDWVRHFDRLTSLDLHDPALLVEWTRDLVRLYVDHGFVTPLVEQLAVFEPAFGRRLQEDGDQLLARLATAGVPGCRRASGMEWEHRLHHARLQLLMKRLDQICGMLARAEANGHDDVYLTVIAEELTSQLG